MRARQPLPRVWMMTDERQGEELWAALKRLPAGSGIVFRHYRLPEGERRRLFCAVRVIARRRRLMLLLAGSPALARAWRADGAHGRFRSQGMLTTSSAHSLSEVRAAEWRGAAIAFLSPLYPTRSHPGAPALGPIRAGLIARQSRIALVALGGMNKRRAHTSAALGLYGWAGIDAWSAGDQKRKAVPT